jgi:phosphoglycerol geranylgeranyltransferase
MTRHCAIFDTSRSLHFLIDPDHWTGHALARLLAQENIIKRVSSVIVGGTYIHSGSFESTMRVCKESGMVVGNFLTAGSLDSLLSPLADFVVLPMTLGATSTRFVTDHVIAAAPTIQRYQLPVVRVAYLQLDGGGPTSAAFFTQTIPIPRRKPEIVRTLALAGRLLGVDAIYLEAGSGARDPVTAQEVAAALEGSEQLPLIVGGGLHDSAICEKLFVAGATSLIIGSALEASDNVAWLPRP